MIGMELLNLLYGNPMSQMGGPNPNPMAPKPAAPPPAAPISPTTGQSMPMSSGDAARNFHANTTGGMVPNAPQPPAGGPPPGGAPAAPPQQSGPPSTSAQSPPDLMNLYMQLEQRNRSANEIDHGLAMMASAFAAPGTQGQIMHSADSFNQQDPGAQLGNLIQLQNMQRMMNMPAPGTGGGTGGTSGTGIDPNVWAMLPPDQRSKILGDIAAGQAAAGTKLTEDVTQGRYEAGAALPKLSASMTDMDNRINIIKTTAEDGGGTALENILSNNAKKSAVTAMVSADPKEGYGASWIQQHQQQWAGLTPAEQAVAMQMRQLSGQVYGEAFSSLGGASRRSTQEVAGIRAGLSQVADLNQPYSSPDGKSGYLPALNNFQDQIHKGMANAYGAAGNLDAIPENLRFGADGQPLVDKSFRPGGQFAGQGGDWLNRPPPQQGGTDFSKMSEPDAKAAYEKLPVGTVYTGPDGKQYRKT